jgi:hypothetical protein
MDRLLSLFGLVRMKDVRDLKKEPLTADELDILYVDVAENRAEGFNNEKHAEMIDLLRKNQVFAEFLDWTITNDVKRAFNATEDERQVVRGAVSRTRYLRSLCLPEDALKDEYRKKIPRFTNRA